MPNSKRPHASDLGKGRTSIQGQMYLVTTVTQKRRPLFNSFENARCVIRAVNYLDMTCQVSTLCYVVMPDHLHWLFTLSGGASLSQVVATAKRRSAYRINDTHGCKGAPVWQAGFHDYALRKDEDIKSVARYIVANPLRAGLVERIGDYPFWDAIWL